MRTLKNFNRIWPEPTPYPTWFSSIMTNVPARYSLGCLSNSFSIWAWWLTNGNVIITMNIENEPSYRPFWWYVLVYDLNYTLQDSWCVNIPQINIYWSDSYIWNYQNLFQNWTSSIITNEFSFNSIDSFVNILYLQNENTWTLNFNNSTNAYKFLDYNTWNQLNSLTVPKWTEWYQEDNQYPYIIYTLTDWSKFILQLLWWTNLSTINYWDETFVTTDYRKRLANWQMFNCVTK